MSEQLPILDELEQADSFLAMSEWLKRCPLATIASHGDKIEAVVHGRGFHAAGHYVQQHVAALHQTRQGEFIPEKEMPFYATLDYSLQIEDQARKLDDHTRIFAVVDLDWHKDQKVRVGFETPRLMVCIKAILDAGPEGLAECLQSSKIDACVIVLALTELLAAKIFVGEADHAG